MGLNMDFTNEAGSAKKVRHRVMPGPPWGEVVLLAHTWRKG
jgi:hypothetical protein